MRVSSSTFPSLIGTLKSTRMNARLLLKSMSLIVSLFTGSQLRAINIQETCSKFEIFDLRSEILCLVSSWYFVDRILFCDKDNPQNHTNKVSTANASSTQSVCQGWPQ